MLGNVVVGLEFATGIMRLFDYLDIELLSIFFKTKFLPASLIIQIQIHFIVQNYFCLKGQKRIKVFLNKKNMNKFYNFGYICLN